MSLVSHVVSGVAGALMLVSSIAAAQAQTTVSAAEPDGIVEILKGFGIARLEQDAGGDPKVSGRIEGQTYTLFFYGCTDNADCRSVSFWSYWPEEAGLEAINEWNKTSRFGRVYIDNDGDIVLEYDVNLSHGVDERTFEVSAETWASLVQRVKDRLLSQ